VTLSAVQDAAEHLTPEDVVKSGQYLGAGIGGGSYAIEYAGQKLVAKQWGHPEATVSKFSPWSPRELQAQAAKQVAVQNALAMTGIPAPVSALMGDGSWVLMQKMEGLPLGDLTEAEMPQAKTLLSELEALAQPIADRTIQQLKPDFQDTPKQMACVVDFTSNTLFERTPQGLAIAGTYDPVA
jgi:hypothetical protein